ncbi:Hypothetical predicted protein [Cloeon dipterum]|uniref:Uncharacterized protein n=1 Tax=Cloeon dipterum TaxID=197152 RepID=A0A8S1E2H7_9INSE|nr:Hypothetical predicted protein [Cloeon dipterum]
MNFVLAGNRTADDEACRAATAAVWYKVQEIPLPRQQSNANARLPLETGIGWRGGGVAAAAAEEGRRGVQAGKARHMPAHGEQAEASTLFSLSTAV